MLAKQKNILIADDEESLRILVRAVLETEGDRFIIDEAIDGDETLNKVMASPPDILILDIMMPSYSGFEICEKLRENDDFADLKIIILTAKGQSTEERWASSVGADYFINKPFSPKELLELVKEISTEL